MASTKNKDDAVIKIFGIEKDQKVDAFSRGTHTFHGAHLLVIPVRSNVKPFFRATSKERLSEFLDKLELFITEGKRDNFYNDLKILLEQDVEKDKPVVFVTL